MSERNDHFRELVSEALSDFDSNAPLQVMAAMIEAWCPERHYDPDYFTSKFHYVLGETRRGNLDMLTQSSYLVWAKYGDDND